MTKESVQWQWLWHGAIASGSWTIYFNENIKMPKFSSISRKDWTQYICCWWKCQYYSSLRFLRDGSKELQECTLSIFQISQLPFHDSSVKFNGIDLAKDANWNPSGWSHFSSLHTTTIRTQVLRLLGSSQGRMDKTRILTSRMSCSLWMFAATSTISRFSSL